MYYIGLDVHKKTISYASFNHTGLLNNGVPKTEERRIPAIFGPNISCLPQLPAPDPDPEWDSPGVSEMIPVRNSYWLSENLPNAVLLTYPDSSSRLRSNAATRIPSSALGKCEGRSFPHLM